MGEGLNVTEQLDELYSLAPDAGKAILHYFGVLPDPAGVMMVGPNGVQFPCHNDTFDPAKVSPDIVSELISLCEGKEMGSKVIVSGDRTLRLLLDPGPINKRGKGLAAFSIHDITDAISKEKALSMMATQDIVTGLYNRNFFQNELGKVAKESVTPDNPLGAIITDVDNFKPVNDTYGHVTGDYYLALIGLLTAMSVRGSQNILKHRDRFTFLLDTETEEGKPFKEAAEYLLQNFGDLPKRQTGALPAGSGQTGELKLRQPDLVARYGGDEFAVILRGLGKRGVDGMTTYLNRVDKLIDNYNELVRSGILHTPEISISFGGVMIDGESLYKIADTKVTGNYVEGQERYFVDKSKLKPDWTPDNIIGAADSLMYSAKEIRKRKQGKTRGTRGYNPWPLREVAQRRRNETLIKNQRFREQQGEAWMARLQQYIDQEPPDPSRYGIAGSLRLRGKDVGDDEINSLQSAEEADAALRRLQQILDNPTSSPQ